MVAVRTGASDDVELARRAVGGDGEAFAELFDRWFDRAFDVAWHIVRNRDTAAEVAQETFATAWEQVGALRQPESFGGWVLRIARNKGLNRLAVEQRARPVGDQAALADHDRERRVADDPAGPVTDRERDDLVWAASAALGDDDASILNLHLRHGLGAGELADELGIAANAAHQRLFRLKKRLGDAIGAWTLWQLGRPRCDALRTLLADAGTTRFDRDAAAMITAHTRGCSDCDDRRTLALSPEAMFAAVPLVTAGPVLKAEAAAALAASGVPTSPGSPEPRPPGRSGSGARRRVALLMAAAVAAVAAVVFLGTRGGPGDDALDLVDAPSETSTTVETSTTTGADAPATSATDPAPPPTAAAVSEPDPVVVSPTTTDPPGTTTTAEPAPPAPAPPVVGGFRATPVSTGNCATPSQTFTTFLWSSTDATSARLGPAGGTAAPVDPSGSHTACAVSGSAWVLTVTGAGGTDSATATVP